MAVLLAPKPLENHTIRDFNMLINGQWLAADSGKMIERLAPAHNVIVSRYPAATGREVERAIAGAKQSFDSGIWAHQTAAQRSAILLKIADLIEQRSEELIYWDAVEAGKPVSQLRGEIAAAADLWRYAAALCRDLHGESYNSLGQAKLAMILREPVGVVAMITPWNFPFLIISQKLPFALAAGCSCVVKPSEMTSASTLILGEIMLAAGLPPGVVNIVTGTGIEAGTLMTTHRDIAMVSFTGSTAIGRLIMANAAQSLKKVALELGGKNPQIVFPDADLESFIDAAVFGAYFNAGECCNAGSRLIVHHTIAENVISRIATLIEKVRLGDPLHQQTQVGAIISPQHQQKLRAFVDQALSSGAKLVCGGNKIEFEQGLFMPLTLLSNVSPEMAIAREEVFGPVLSVMTFTTEQEAISIANSIDYGLSASVWSRDFDTCLQISRQLHAGTVWVNSFMDGAAELPFGGYKQSGLGRELGRYAVEDYTETKTVNMHIGARYPHWVCDR